MHSGRRHAVEDTTLTFNITDTICKLTTLRARSRLVCDEFVTHGVHPPPNCSAKVPRRGHGGDPRSIGASAAASSIRNVGLRTRGTFLGPSQETIHLCALVFAGLRSTATHSNMAVAMAAGDMCHVVDQRLHDTRLRRQQVTIEINANASLTLAAASYSRPLTGPKSTTRVGCRTSAAYTARLTSKGAWVMCAVAESIRCQPCHCRAWCPRV
mmetsp:Transcript_55239/g.139551  ORF Transcript_55239/g.139551 Transcript_55239/m.139551 type:complete len:212 (-) Transcript_55239:1794-2429(-)